MKYLTYICITFLLAACYGKAPVYKSGLEGTPMPAFNLFMIDSVTYFNTRHIPEGKPVVFFYFGPDCPYCRAELNEIKENMGKLKNIQFYMITSVQYPDMKKFYTEFKLSEYPNITMGIDYQNGFTKYFKPNGIPYLAVFTGKKKLAQVFPGKTPVADIQAAAE